jgi:hypothetical protein
MAATAPILHADQIGDSIIVGENLKLAQELGLLVNGDVGAGKTEVTMEAALVTNAQTLHAEFQGYIDRLKRALQLGLTIGILTTANVQGVTTLAELIAICLSDPNKRGPLAIE